MKKKIREIPTKKNIAKQTKNFKKNYAQIQIIRELNI